MDSQKLIKRREKTKWYQEARFGMFLHWGLYSVPAMDEWIQSQQEMTSEEYEKYMESFTAENFEPKKWAKMAKEAGMKYAILTAKHHDGFCLFDSQWTDYTVMKTPANRDLVREFLDAFRDEGLKVGLYYSLIDWHHPDYPHYGDRGHPQRNNEKYKGVKNNFSNYLKYMHAQIEELLTQYGKLDIMWFDYSYDELKGEAWGANAIMDMIDEYQPDMLIDNRMEGSGLETGSILTDNPTRYSGSFASPEQMIPPKGLTDTLGNVVPWESCITLNKHWCYSPYDKHYKSAKMIIRMLVECVSKNGNLLINVGPSPKGEFPKEAVQCLAEVADWMSRNHESIYRCGEADYPKPEWGRFTQRGSTVYAHVLEESVTAIPLNLNKKIKRMELLADGTEVVSTDFWTLSEYQDYTYFFFNRADTDCYPLPDEVDTVVKIYLDE